jgi:Cof subfamily protein (haloacid dehalogenase superfamily)
LIYAPFSHSVVYSMPIDPAVIKEAIAYCRSNGVYLELYSREVFFAEKENWSDDIHQNFFGVSPTFVNFDDIADEEQILKAELVVHNPEEAAEAKKLADCFDGKLSYSVAYTPAFTDVEFLNLVNPRVSKGAALKHLAGELGAYYTEIIAIGDGLNDISLLKEAGNAVAMGNAPDEVKQVCQYTTLDVDHHGVAEAIKYFFPQL